MIDDNEDILFTLKMLLRPLAESVTTSTNPKEINRLVSTTKYNVILLDMMLPDMDGLDVLRPARTLKRSTGSYRLPNTMSSCSI